MAGRSPTCPRKYWHCHDLFVALTAAAAATSTLRVGSGICLVIQRDPIVTAKEVASIDRLSGGRFEFGVGAGWNLEEMRNHGTDPRTRLVADARARRGDEGDLDAGGGELPRRARRLRADLVAPKARAAPTPAGADRRRRSRGARPRARVRRRLAAALLPGLERDRAYAGAARPRRAPDRDERLHAGRRRTSSSGSPTPGPSARCTGCPPGARRPSSRRSSAGRRRSPSTSAVDRRRGAAAVRAGARRAARDARCGRARTWSRSPSRSPAS